jgi:methylaspartate mutase sigma subunit
VGKQENAEVLERFSKLGFNRVYPPGVNIEAGIEDLKNDLNIK